MFSRLSQTLKTLITIVLLTSCLTACNSLPQPQFCNYGLVKITGLSSETKKTLNRKQAEDLNNNNDIIGKYCPSTRQ